MCSCWCHLSLSVFTKTCSPLLKELNATATLRSLCHLANDTIFCHYLRLSLTPFPLYLLTKRQTTCFVQFPAFALLSVSAHLSCSPTVTAPQKLLLLVPGLCACPCPLRMAVNSAFVSGPFTLAPVSVHWESSQLYDQNLIF